MTSNKESLLGIKLPKWMGYASVAIMIAFTAVLNFTGIYPDYFGQGSNDLILSVSGFMFFGLPSLCFFGWSYNAKDRRNRIFLAIVGLIILAALVLVSVNWVS
jgi:hypothetical protein